MHEEALQEYKSKVETDMKRFENQKVEDIGKIKNAATEEEKQQFKVSL